MLLKRLLLGIEEQRTQAVETGSQARGERDREPIGRQHVERAAFHERGSAHARQELTRPRRGAFGLRAPLHRRARGDQAEQIILFELLEAQDARERGEDLR